MPNTKMKKDDWKNFFHYSKWIYLILIVCVFVVTDIIFSATRYTTPPEKEVNFQIVTGFVDTDGGLMQVAEHALAVGQEADPELESVVFYNLGYDPKDTTDAYGIQKYQLMLGVAEGDVYILQRELMGPLVNSGYLLPLEGYIEQGILDPGDVDLKSVTFHESEELDDYDPNAMHVYAIPMTNLYRMMEDDIKLDNRQFYMVLMGFSTNPDTSAVVMNDVIAQLTAEKPQWLVEYEALQAEQAAEEETTVFDEVLEDAGF